MHNRGWIAILLMALAVSTVAQSAPQVKTDNGPVEGKSVGTINAFLGIPYAAPPIGDLRWKAPSPPAKWTGVRKATGFGARCMQGNVFGDMVFRDPSPSEDCLTLNVWAPAGAKDLPVMVWIYGGGFVAGATSEQRQDGEKLAQQGVVVVSMNYRLGIFGFLALSELAAESGHKASGNYGLLDQVAALQWVQHNIAGFGGGPNNVTIFGESAGSFSVSSLMASPLAKGLFQKAIGESGAAFNSQGLPYISKRVRQREDLKFLKDFLHVKSLAELRALPAEKVQEAEAKKEERSDPRGFTPDIDGYLLPEPVSALFSKGKQNDVPLLAGWNRDEGIFELGGHDKPTAANAKAAAEKEFGAHAAEFLKLYPAKSDPEALRSAEDLAGDRFIAYSTWRWMDAQKATGKQVVYRYRFDLSLPSPEKQPDGLGAYHSAEIEYVFGQLDSKALPWRTQDRHLSEQMQKYWANFARSGDPNGPGLPKWPVYDSHTGWQVMHLDEMPEAANDSSRGRYLFLQKAWESSAAQ